MEMVLPASYAVIEEEEMMYLEGGATARVRGTAGSIRTRLNAIIAGSAAGQATVTGLGALLGGAIGAVVGFFVGSSWFGTINSYSRTAHSQVSKIISKYGTRKAVVMTSTWSTIFCTGVNVKVA